MTLEDRIALLLGRAIIRAEALQAELDELKQQIAKRPEDGKK